VPQPILFLEIFLVAVGFVFLILEFKLPGHFVSGIFAVGCFAVFFWLHFQHGGPIVLIAVTLFILGLVLVGIEIFFIPGHGVAGVGGVCLMLIGLVLGGIDEWPNSASEWADMLARLLRHLLTMTGAAIAAFILAKHLPDIPYVNWLVLVPPVDNPDAELALPGADKAAELLGSIGTATSALRPGGIAHFDNRRVDVCTEWEFIEPGTRIQVVEVEGMRIVVKKV
jgi:membrane-bound serine protease (ClpP class)